MNKNNLLKNEYQDILSTEDCIIGALEKEETMNEETQTQEEVAVEAVEKMSALKQAMLLKKSKKKARKTLEKQGYDKTAATKLVKGALRNMSNKPMKRAAGRGG
jgi:hypothetical protein